jgi:hypothetical protein
MSNKQKNKISSKKSPTNEAIDPDILYNFIDQTTEAQDEMILATKTLITCTQESKQAFDETKAEIKVSIHIYMKLNIYTNSNFLFRI